VFPVAGWLVAPELGVTWAPDEADAPVLPAEALVAPEDTAAPPVDAEEVAVVSVVEVAVVGVIEAVAAAEPPGIVSVGAPEVLADDVPEELPQAAIVVAESRPAASAPSVASEGDRRGT
jgi:hypothetical protein